MSAYTTLRISREKAIEQIKEKAEKLDNKQLEDIMDILLEKNLYNCVISPYPEDEKHPAFGVLKD